jgi:hypothetical protein
MVRQGLEGFRARGQKRPRKEGAERVGPLAPTAEDVGWPLKTSTADATGGECARGDWTPDPGSRESNLTKCIRSRPSKVRRPGTIRGSSDSFAIRDLSAESRGHWQRAVQGSSPAIDPSGHGPDPGAPAPSGNILSEAPLAGAAPLRRC